MISAVLLGAGEGKRMGKDKLSLPLGEKTVLERSLEALVRSDVDEVLVVVREKPEDRGGLFRDRRVRFVINPDFRCGMSASVRRGIRAMNPRSQGVLIALGDQPFLKPRTINALIRAFLRNKGGIVLPVYRGKTGHPVLFDRSFAARLLQLEGDVGGRSVVEAHREKIVLVRTRSKAVLQDIDTRKDYREACQKQSDGLKARRRHR
jgi:molybdenum cofactor cytidylyltransferase